MPSSFSGGFSSPPATSVIFCLPKKPVVFHLLLGDPPRPRFEATVQTPTSPRASPNYAVPWWSGFIWIAGYENPPWNEDVPYIFAPWEWDFFGKTMYIYLYNSSPLQFPLQNGWGRAQNKMDIQYIHLVNWKKNCNSLLGSALFSGANLLRFREGRSTRQSNLHLLRWTGFKWHVFWRGGPKCRTSERCSPGCLAHTIHGHGILTYIWLIFMVNVGKYTIHGWHG